MYTIHFFTLIILICRGAAYSSRTILRCFREPARTSLAAKPRTCSRLGECRPAPDHAGLTTSKTCVDSRNNHTQQHRGGNDDAHRTHYGATAAFTLLTIVLIVTHVAKVYATRRTLLPSPMSRPASSDEEPTRTAPSRGHARCCLLYTSPSPRD